MADDKRVRLHELDLPALEALLEGWGEPRAHAREVWQWLYQWTATDFEPHSGFEPWIRSLRHVSILTICAASCVPWKCSN